MEPLLNLLATGRGADLIIICRGEFFLVHKAVIEAQSPVLKSDIGDSEFLNGEACPLNDVAPAVFRKVLPFMYRGRISDYDGLSGAVDMVGDLTGPSEAGKVFPATDEFLSTVMGKRVIDSVARDSITNEDKWEIIYVKQSRMNAPYDFRPCITPADVSAELGLLKVAETLKITALKEVTMAKVSAWLERELLKGPPLSDGFRDSINIIFGEHGDLATSFVGLCAKHFPYVERDEFIPALMEEFLPTTWKLLLCVRSQWVAQLEERTQVLRESNDEIMSLSSRLNSKELAKAEHARKYQSEVEELKQKLALAQQDTKVAEAAAERLEIQLKSVQSELLMTNEQMVGLKKALKGKEWVEQAREQEARKQEGRHQAGRQQEARQQEARQQKEARPVQDQHLFREIATLKHRLTTREEALRQSKDASQKNKAELQERFQKSSQLTEEMNIVFKLFMKDVNHSGCCERCGQRWNMNVKREGESSIVLRCNTCSHEDCFQANQL